MHLCGAGSIIYAGPRSWPASGCGGGHHSGHSGGRQYRRVPLQNQDRRGAWGRLTVITNLTLPLILALAGQWTWSQPSWCVVSHSLTHTGADVSLAIAAVPEGLPFVVSAAHRASATRRLTVEVVLVRIPVRSVSWAE